MPAHRFHGLAESPRLNDVIDRVVRSDQRRRSGTSSRGKNQAHLDVLRPVDPASSQPERLGSPAWWVDIDGPGIAKAGLRHRDTMPSDGGPNAGELFQGARRTALALCISWVGGCAIYGIFAKPEIYLTYSVSTPR